MENYFGQNGFTWFIGVVEDRMDPEKLGRVRVRCLGHHSPDILDIPRDHLPWSTVMAPTTNPSMNGLGSTPPFLVEGSWVTGFFLDQFRQESVIVGSLPGYNNPTEDALGKDGFKDPAGLYPRKDHSETMDTNVLSDFEIEESPNHPSLKWRNENLIKDVPTATKPNQGEATKWNELETLNKSKYPLNHVKESESGHIMEIDDTPENERLLDYHRTGTFNEIRPDGTKLSKIVGDEYEIIIKDKNVLISGNCNITVNGNCNQLIKGDYALEVMGSYTEKIHGDQHTLVTGRCDIDAGPNLELTAGRIDLN